MFAGAQSNDNATNFVFQSKHSLSKLYWYWFHFQTNFNVLLAQHLLWASQLTLSLCFCRHSYCFHQFPTVSHTSLFRPCISPNVFSNGIIKCSQQFLRRNFYCFLVFTWLISALWKAFLRVANNRKDHNNNFE